MEELSITINIAGREYRLKANQKEKELIEEAALQINEAMKTFAEHYAFKDNQDLLAMVALQEALNCLKGEVELKDTENSIEKHLILIDELLNNDCTE